MAIGWAALAPGCGREPPANVQPGDPLPGLSVVEVERFHRGRALFEHGFTPEEGLGPLFIEDRCASCHDLPAPGGTGVEDLLLASRFRPPGECDLLTDEGGPVIQQQVTPLLRERGIDGEVLPRRATAAQLFAPLLYGLGLVEAIPERAILSLEDPEDLDGDGISGRARRTADGRLGRFGRKAAVATLREMVDAAAGIELGLTTSAHRAEERVNGRPVPPGADPAPDPEIGDSTLDVWSDFVRFLAPPARKTLSARAERDSARRGQRVFYQIGCDDCHVPAMQTGRSDIPALDRKTVLLYSDMLLHDLGQEMAGVCDEAASPTELRTARLWGLRHLPGYMYDRRASSLHESVMLHGGEGSASRERFRRLRVSEQLYLFAFLNSL